MIFSRFIIYGLVFLILSFAAVSNNDINNNKHTSSSGIINIDSLHSLISKNNQAGGYLEEYSNLLINSDINLDDELAFLKNSGDSFNADYLSAVILKRQGRYHEMYNRLIPLLKQSPSFIPFYDELLFAAQAADSISSLRLLIEQATVKEKYRNYLLAMINYAQGNYSAALAELNKIESIDSTNKFVLYQLSYTQRNLGNYVDALNSAERSLKYCGFNNNFACKIYLAIGSLYYLSGKYKSADDYYKKAYNLSSEINNKYDKSVALVDLAIMLDQNGDIVNARKNYKEAISIADNYNFIEPKALAHSELGVSFTYTNELLKAKENYTASYSLYNKLGNKLRLSLLSDNLARLYMSEFNYRAAKALYEKGLRFAGGNRRAQAINLVGLADVYANLSNYAKALEYYSKARDISSQIKNIELEADISSGVGTLDYNLNNFKGALINYKKVNELRLRAGNNYLLAESYHNIGLAYLRMDSLDLAQVNLIKAVDISAKYSDILMNAISSADLAYLLIEKGDLSGASVYLAAANKISVEYNLKYLVSLTTFIKGKIYEAGKNYLLAGESYYKALENIKSVNEPNLKIELYYSLARLDEIENNYKSAENNYKEAIKIIELISNSLYSKDEVQIAYFSGKSEVFNSYIGLLLKEGKNRTAFLVLDKSRSRNTNQNLFNLRLESEIKDDNILNKLYDYQWIINSGLYDRAQSDSVRNIYHQTISELSSQYPLLPDPDESGIFSESIDDIQKNLSSDEYIISLFSSNDNLYLFRISRSGFDLFNIDLTRSRLMNLIADISPYFKSNNNPGRIFYNQDLFSFNSDASYKLYRELLLAALKDIPRDGKIIFSLSPELVTFPFEFLVTDESTSSSAYSYSNNHYLIEDYQISYTPSVGLFIKEKNNNLKNDGKTLIVGNPTINNSLSGFSERRGLIEESGGLPRDLALLPLKYSEDEVNEISSLIRADKILIENNATETNFKEYAHLSNIIHLSTHSFLLNNQPVIFLSNKSDPSNDGLLEAGEIVQMRLNSDLVVLSSCSSGLGQIDESEGIIGMTKAFYEAGAKSVVVSLWQVNDKYTSKLMALFYKNLSKGLDKSEALRQAKIKFIKEYSANPYYWGAFILSGNVASIKLNPVNQINSLILYLVGILLLSVILFLFKSARKGQNNH